LSTLIPRGRLKLTPMNTYSQTYYGEMYDGIYYSRYGT
jgi:hypothetical protein